MAYVLTDGSTTVVTYPYSIGLLRGDNPTVSFPASPSDTLLAEWNVFPVTNTTQPSIDTLTEYITEANPIFVTDHWEQVWVVNTYTVGEAAAVLAQFEENAANEAAARFEATNKYITQSLTEGLELTPDLIAYRAALMDPTALTGYPNNITWPTEPTQYFVGVGATKVASIEVENLNVTGTMVLGGASGSVVTQEYVDDAIASIVDSSPTTLNTLNELAAALGDDPNFATTLATQIGLKANSADVYTKTETFTKAEVNSAISTAVAPKANSADVYIKSEVYTKAETNTVIAAATTGLALTDKVLNLQAPVSPSTTPVIAPALATIGTTNGYTLNLSFGNFDEVGPIVFNEKWQLQVDGPPAATTTAVTIKNGITIQNSNGVRLTRVQIEGTSSVSCRAGLGLHFEKVQFMGPLTLGGTGGFMMFTDVEFGGNITISPTFAGVIYFIRCSFSGASATYTFGQTSSQQVIVMDSSGIPNTGFVSGATAKASYSGMITYKNVSQAFFVNNIPVTTAGATSGQVLKYNGTVFAPAADSATDATKLPLAGGTMSGAIAMSNNKVTGLGAPTANTDAATKAYVDSTASNKLSLTGGTVNGDFNVVGSSLSFNVLPNDGVFSISDGSSTTDISPTSLSIVSANGSATFAQGGVLSLYSNINTLTSVTPTQPYHAATKEYVDNLVANASYLPITGGTMSGEVDMGFQKIVGLADPEWPQDAVNKQYVDTAVASAGGGGGGSSNTTWNAENGSVWNIIEVSGGRTVSFTHQQDGHLGTYQILNTSTATPVTIQTTTVTAELELNAVTIPFEHLPVLQASYLIGGTVVVNGVTYNLDGSYGYSGESGPISLGTVELVSYGVGDSVTVNITSYATDGYFVSLDGNQIAANDPLYAQHVVNSVSTVTIDGTPHTIYATDTVLGPAEGQVTFNVYFNISEKLVPNQSVDLQLTIPEQANLWINPAVDFGVSTQELRGYSLDYHIYSQDCGTLIGKIIVAIDDNPRVTNILAASGSSDVGAIDIETYSSDWSTDKGLLFRRTDPEDDTIMIQWSGKAFYSPEWYD